MNSSRFVQESSPGSYRHDDRSWQQLHAVFLRAPKSILLSESQIYRLIMLSSGILANRILHCNCASGHRCERTCPKSLTHDCAAIGGNHGSLTRWIPTLSIPAS